MHFLRRANKTEVMDGYHFSYYCVTCPSITLKTAHICTLVILFFQSINMRKWKTMIILWSFTQLNVWTALKDLWINGIRMDDDWQCRFSIFDSHAVTLHSRVWHDLACGSITHCFICVYASMTIIHLVDRNKGTQQGKLWYGFDLKKKCNKRSRQWIKALLTDYVISGGRRTAAEQ